MSQREEYMLDSVEDTTPRSRKECGALSRRLVGAVGLKWIADLWGCDVSTVSRWSSSGGGALWRVRQSLIDYQAETGKTDFVIDLLRFLGRPFRLIPVQEPESAPGRVSLNAALARSNKESADVSIVLYEASADGRLTAEELHSIRSELEESIAWQTHLLEQVRVLESSATQANNHEVILEDKTQISRMGG